MNKTWIFIAVVGTVMVGVMVFLTIKGVSHREHTFIKWSVVTDADGMGKYSMRRLFPLLKDISRIRVRGDSSMASGFVHGFLGELQKQNISLDVAVDSMDESQGTATVMRVEMIPLDIETSPGSCSEVSRDRCLYFKALRSWLKKERDRSRSWFLLQWVSHNQFSLFYTKPSQ